MKRITALLMALVMALSLAGCSSSSQNDGTTDAATTAASSAADTTQAATDAAVSLPEGAEEWMAQYTDFEPVTITFGGWGDYFQLREHCDAFQEKYSWITVEVTKPIVSDLYAADLMALAATGEMPDVFNIENLYTAMQNEWCLDITDYFESDPENETYPDWLMQYSTANDRIYTVISTMYADLVEVNMDLLDEYNIEVPGYDWTVDEWADILRKTTVAGSSVGTNNLKNFLAALPAIYDEDLGHYSYNPETKQFEFGEAFIKSVNLIKELYDDGVSLNQTLDIQIGTTASAADEAAKTAITNARNEYQMENYGTTSNHWFKSVVGLRHGSSWDLNWPAENADYTGFNWDIYPFPVANEGDEPRVSVVIELMSVSASAEHPFESYLLMKYMSFDIDGYEAKVNIMANYDKEAYMAKYTGYTEADFGGTLFNYQVAPSNDPRVLELYTQINPSHGKDGLELIFQYLTTGEGGYLKNTRILPAGGTLNDQIWDTIVNEVLTGNKTAADIAEELQESVNAALNEKRAEYGLN